MSDVFKFNEDQYLKEIEQYIENTYNSHYGGKIQTIEYIMDKMNGFDYFKGTILAYVDRFGKKDGHNRKDLIKAIHFLMLTLFYLDKKNSETQPTANISISDLPNKEISELIMLPETANLSLTGIAYRPYDPRFTSTAVISVEDKINYMTFNMPEPVEYNINREFYNDR